MNFRRHLTSPRSFQHSAAGSARDKLPTCRQPAYRCTSCVYPSVIPCQLIYKLSNTSACSNIRVPPDQSDFGLKSFVTNKTFQSSPQMATRHSIHPLPIIPPTYLHSLLSLPSRPRLFHFHVPSNLPGQRQLTSLLRHPANLKFLDPNNQHPYCLQCHPLLYKDPLRLATENPDLHHLRENLSSLLRIKRARG